MRRLIVKVTERFSDRINAMQDRLSAFFPKVTGSFDAFETDTITEDAAYDFVYSAERAFGYTVSCSLSINMLKTRTDARGRKNSRNLADFFRARGVDTDGGRYQDWLAKWMAAFRSSGFGYSIEWTPEAFDSLGQIRGVDAGRSCFRDGGAWQDGPATLLGGMFGDVSCFVIRLLHDATPVGRCWGLVPNGEGYVFLSNAYTANTDMQRDLGIAMDRSLRPFVRAIGDSKGAEWAYKQYDPEGSWPVYINGDMVMAWPKAQGQPAYVEELNLTPDKCALCASENKSDDHAFCDCCTAGRDHVCGCGARVYESDMRPGCSLCDPNGEQSMCNYCYSLRHPYCCGCSMQVCQEAGGMVTVQTGDYRRGDGSIVVYHDQYCRACAERRARKCFCGTYYHGLLTPETCVVC